MSQTVTISRGVVVGIGELKVFPSNAFPYEIPVLSFLVVQEQENVYSSICMNLHIDGDGASPEEARENMKEHILEFLDENFKGDRAKGPAWDHLNELFQIDDTTRELWNAYRTSEIKYSQHEIKTDIASKTEIKMEYQKVA